MNICKNDRCLQIIPPSRNPGRPRLFCSIRCKTAYHVRQYYQRERQREQNEHRGSHDASPEEQVRICKNDRCSQVVPPSAGNRPRLFCSRRCAVQYHTRLFHERETKATFDGMLRVKNHKPQVYRRMPRSLAIAQQRRQEHDRYCFIHNGPCPAGLKDRSGRRKLCLVYAVFTDDIRQLLSFERPYMSDEYPRLATSMDGRWLDDLTPEELNAEKRRWQVLIRGKKAGEAAVGIDDDTLAAFIAAGGAKLEGGA